MFCKIFLSLETKQYKKVYLVNSNEGSFEIFCKIFSSLEISKNKTKCFSNKPSQNCLNLQYNFSNEKRLKLFEKWYILQIY